MITPTTLHRAMPIVAAALGRKFGVAVRVGGHEALTDGQTIVVPDLPSDSALLPVAWGYLAHEAAHLRYTDFAVYQRAAQAGDALSRQILNILEDVRIERALAGPYPGTRETLQAVCAHLREIGAMTAASADAHPAQILSSYLLLSLRHRVLGYRLLATEAQRAEARLRAVFPARTVHRLQGLLTEVAQLQSTEAVVELTGRVRDLLEAENRDAGAAQAAPRRPQAAQPQAPSPDAMQDDPQQGDGAARACAQLTSVAGTDGPDDSVNDPTGAADQGQRPEPAEGSDPDQPGASTDAHDRGSSDSDTSADRTSAAKQAKPDDASTTPDATAAQLSALNQALQATDADLPADPFETLRGLLAAAGSGQSRCVLPHGERFLGDAQAGLERLAQVQQTSRALMARLHGLVQASRLDRSQAHRHGPRLLSKRLYRSATGDPRIFARKRERIAVETALHLLIDLSGSMMASVRCDADDSLKRRLDIALESALALALALDQLNGVSVAVSAFPGQDGEAQTATVMVRHGERPRTRAGAFVQEARGTTPMAGALWFAAADLLARPESRRIVLVLTDGKPDAFDDTRDILRLCQAGGLETVGIGIGVDVSALFPIALRVHAATELKQALFGVAERLLIAA
ncbi:VWA domain-containing protein [Thiohalocapsa marina]|uniref:VWA domain-containing protein n=1 Tax=Thiohalocapsa marina TaxID=424902 RepID=UPI0036DC6D35